MDLIANSYYYA